ncbi:MAG: hypothetical protein IPK22_07205 [Verrucomicrobiaceae bacterium]|nr:hypothetical protein [Verrucomicrobiaceae bacterium]
MKTILFILVCASAALSPAFAQAQDTEVKVQRRTLDREDKLNRPKKNAQELTCGLRITVKNATTKPLGEGEIEWAVLVQRPSGQRKALYSSGKEKLPSLQALAEMTMDVGAVAVQHDGSKRQEMEYQVIVRRDGVEVAKAESTPSFSQQAESASGAKKKSKATGKQK